MAFVIFDTEYTSWKGCQEHGWLGRQKKEIVQIAALKVSEDFRVLATFNQLCQPVFNPILSDYFMNLTHITNEDIKRQGVPFAEVYMKFCDFVQNKVCFSHAWGSDFFHPSDGAVIDENLNLCSIKKADHIVYRNIGAVFSDLYHKKNINITSQTAGQIAQLLHVDYQLKKLGIKPHNALYDVYSILEGLRYFRNDIIALKDKGFKV